MFDIAWSEIGVILLVALVVVGPKDIPVVVRTVRGYMRKLQNIRQEVVKALDEVAGETEITHLQHDLKKEVEQLNHQIRYITDLEGKKQPAYDLSDLRPDLVMNDHDEKTTLH